MTVIRREAKGTQTDEEFLKTEREFEQELDRVRQQAARTRARIEELFGPANKAKARRV